MAPMYRQVAIRAFTALLENLIPTSACATHALRANVPRRTATTALHANQESILGLERGKPALHPALFAPPVNGAIELASNAASESASGDDSRDGDSEVDLDDACAHDHAPHPIADETRLVHLAFDAELRAQHAQQTLERPPRRA